MSKRILIVTTSHDRMGESKRTGVWLEEFVVPYEYFTEAGATITVASPAGGDVPIDMRSLSSLNTKEHGDAIKALMGTAVLAEQKAEDFDCIFFPGGHGPMYDLANDEASASLISAIAKNGGVVTALCHGPAALVPAKNADGEPLIKGRQVTGFSDAEEEMAGVVPLMPFLLETRMRELGGKYEGGAAWKEHVVVDGKLITGRNPASSAAAAKATWTALNQG